MPDPNENDPPESDGDAEVGVRTTLDYTVIRGGEDDSQSNSRDDSQTDQDDA